LQVHDKGVICNRLTKFYAFVISDLGALFLARFSAPRAAGRGQIQVGVLTDGGVK
jgi:hypothetical protein